MPTDLLVATALKALAELVGLFLIGRGLIAMLVKFMRQAPDRNVIYQLFVVLTKPVISLVRKVTPSVVVDRHLPVVAFLLVVWIYLLAAGWKLSLCGQYADKGFGPCSAYSSAARQ